MPFRDVSGHRRIVDLLARSVARDSVPPSLVFSGPPGSGKRQTAIALAQALNCSKRPAPGTRESADACGACPACQRIARGLHPDVLVVEPGDTGTIKIDQVRDVIDRAAYRPFEGKSRVVIVDDADALVPSAQNALLKTLEEPPSASVFILVTSRPDMLLPTVRSRCIRLFFVDPTEADVDRDAREVAHRVLAHAARAAGGSRLEGAKELLTKTGGTAASDREQVIAHLRAMASLLRDIEVISTRAANTTLANADFQPALDRLVPAYQGGRGVRAFAAIDTALEAIKGNAGIKIVADWLVMQL